MKGRFWRKALAAALALLVVSGNVPIKPVADLFGGAAITASALESETSSQCGENAYFSFDTDTGKLTISGTGAMYDYSYNAMPWNNYKDNITSVEIENGITSIGKYAFEGCTNLTSIKISDSVKSIGSYAFQNCTSLASIEIPKNVTSIGVDSFYLCTGITEVYCYADPANLTWAEAGCDDFIRSETGKPTICRVPAEYYETYNTKFGTGSDYPVNVTFKAINPTGECGEDAAWELDLDTGKLTISGTGTMYDYYGNGDQPWDNYKDKITSVEIENGITSIGNSAFYSCAALTSITIPDSVESIGSYAFLNCTSLASITIPKNVTSIGEEAFLNCTNIKEVSCDADPAKLTWNEGGCDDFIRSPKHTTVCHVPAEYYFQYVKKFGSSVNVTFKAIPPTGECGEDATWEFDLDTGKLTISGTGAMYNYSYKTQPWYNYKDNITSVEIENGITSIGTSSFYKFTSLASIKIPDSVTSIGNDALFNCTGLTSITISDSVTSIGADAFYGCTNITDVYCYVAPSKLTWNEGSCDDFIRPQNSKMTVCHVPAEYLDTYNSEKFSDVNVRFVGDLVDMGLGEHLYGHSITLDGSIGVNFYVELTDELLASETAEMVFTVPNGSKTDTQTLLVKDVIANSDNKVVIGGKTYYKFRCSISAKDMASEITAQLVDGESKGKEYTYSVKDYAEYILEHNEVEEYANAAPLVKAMLNYGAASQTYFGIEGTAANASLTDADKALDNVTIPAKFEYDDNASLPEGVTFEGATLSLKSETTLSLYFKGLPEGTTFTCDGKTVETVKNGKYVVARIRGIKANELEKDFTVTFADNSVTYNVMTYCYNVLNDSTVGENLKNVCCALYRYAEAANAYFGEGERDDQDTDW